MRDDTDKRLRTQQEDMHAATGKAAEREPEMTISSSHGDGLPPPPAQRSVRRPWGAEAVIVLLGLAVPLAGSVLMVRDDGQLACLGRADQPLPSLCLWQHWTGLRCPLCGLSRSIVYLMHGQWAASLSAHRCGWVVLLALTGPLPWRWRRWQRARRGEPPAPLPAERLLWSLVVLLLLVNRLADFMAGW